MLVANDDDLVAAIVGQQMAAVHCDELDVWVVVVVVHTRMLVGVGVEEEEPHTQMVVGVVEGGEGQAHVVEVVVFVVVVMVLVFWWRVENIQPEKELEPLQAVAFYADK